MQRYLILFASALLLVACSGGKPDDSSTTLEQPQPGQVDFDAMTKSQKKKYMKEVVKPRMQEVLKEFDAEKFADVDCTTCHGESVFVNDFSMPSDDLPKLGPIPEVAEEYPRWTEFMKSRVVPEMATLLGEKPYDPQTKTGFGCGECHMMKQSAPAP